MIQFYRLAPAVLLAAAACSAPGEQQSAAARDSAGVQVVQRTDPPRQTPAWRMADAPAVELAGAGSGASAGLFQVVSAFRLSDGRIVVASAGTSELGIYGADGVHQRTVGREGEGPGEFGQLFWAGRWRGDSIAAWDARLARLSIFDAGGTFVRTLTPRAQLGIFPRVRGVLADGSVVVASGVDPSRPTAMSTGVRRDSTTLLVIGPDGSVRDTLGRVPDSEQYLMAPPGGGFFMHPLPFGRTTAVAAQGSQVAIGTGDRDEFAVYEPGPGLRRIIRGERERRRVTSDDVRRYRETTLAVGGAVNPSARRQQQQFLREVPYPEHMPASGEILADGQGNWWIQNAEADDGASAWSLVGADGRVLGAFVAPAGLEVKEIGSDWVLGVHLDENDVERVRLYPLIH